MSAHVPPVPDARAERSLRAMVLILRVLAPLALVAAVLFSAGCDLIGGDSTGPTQVVNVNVNTSSPNPTPSSSPGGAIASVSVGPFAWACTKPDDNHVPVGCTVTFTATPKFASGADAPESVHGPNAEWLIVSGSGAISLADYGGNQFNKLARGLAPGPFRLRVTVQGVAGEYAGDVR